MMGNRMAVWVAFMALGMASLRGAGVKDSQTFTLAAGWNAVYITVQPDESADEVFVTWPVERVAVYDPASFLATKQYSGTASTEGTKASAYKMWRRGAPALSGLRNIVANQIYVCNNTNAEAFTVTLYGRPAAPRLTWHPSTTNEPMNFVGLSVAKGATTTLGGYFDGFTGGNVSYYHFYGFGDTIQLGLVMASERFSDGEVLVASASRVSDWSGVLNVTPPGGINFSTNGNYQTLAVRNDGTVARTVSISMGAGAGAVGAVPPPPTGLYVRESAGRTNEWTAFVAGTVFEKRLAAGEKLTLEIALDRAQLARQAGFYYGGLLTITDRDGGSNMRVTVPLEATSDGGTSAAKAWPKGIWLAAGALDTVTYLRGSESREVKAGGTMKVRLPLYVENDGTMRLLQRFVYGVDTNGASHVYSAKVEDAFPVAIGQVKRVSSAVLPIEEPIIQTYETTNYVTIVTTNVTEEAGVFETNVEERVEVAGVVTNGAFGTQAKFGFTVGERSKVNPYRHAFHPNHDGLRWDFETATPSGDDFANYVSTVKPEIFSVGNLITFEWDASTGSQWTPEERLSGNLTWELKGVRHEGSIRMKGRFTMTRISDADLDK